MNSNRSSSNTNLRLAVFLSLCLLLGTDALLRAQDGTIYRQTNVGPAALPDAPSFVPVSQNNLAQSDSKSQSTTQVQASSPDRQVVSAKVSIPNYRRFKVREKLYLFDLVGPNAFLVAGVQAGVDQARTLKVPYPPDGYAGPGNHQAHGAVPEWGEGAEGYAKRYASRFGQELIGTTIRYGLDEVLQQDVTYHRCSCTGILPRVSHAFVYSLVAYTKSGRAVPSLPAIVSPFLASEIAVKSWYPDRFNTSDALRTSANVYYTLPLKNLFFEFRKQ